MKYLILALSLFTFGCLQDESATTTSTSTSTSATVIKVDISGKNNLVMVKTSSVSSSSKLNLSPSFAASASDCLTVGDIGTGTVQSVVATSGLCFKSLEKIDNSGGHAVWSVDTSNDVEKCGIINADGSVWETDKCPKQNGGFKNNKALIRVSSSILRGISASGDYIEYDQSADTATVLIDDTNSIDTIYEIQHTNKKQYLYKVGSTVKQKVDNISSIVPELGDKEFHPIGDKIQILDGNSFKRGYFDSDANVTQYPSGTAYYQSSPVPTAYAAWALSGGTKPTGPTYNGNLSDCQKDTIGTYNIMFCTGAIYKYSDATPDLETVSGGTSGIGSNGISCATSGHIYYYAGSKNAAGNYVAFVLTKSDVINQTYSRIFQIEDASGDMTTEQIANYSIQSMACSDSTVTAMTATRTILINTADATPDVNYLDIAVESVIQN